ncbi:glycogen branching enzyme [Desulfobulbus propionicus DSM 2032]|jgi:1,4-alpha-glucan branching enzyme|uniref:1,4-alpha-glucan branching enzyme GlgB n=1 Tax=Desulfobulbus propionicus (strain ATCC 33891 / DSM 2032 / VKM B-1956 / 1pr3) TaxID=577650 RepID=A0A7U3YKP6_DESPD|nr:1,4-alpha-glucan branching protein GlgB [Desulfobulbus propionicus]ADW17149.1 glycogen branching enzyme [Desulfobulbus propionicus DSM 2032]
MKREIPAGRAVPADWLSNFDRYLISEGTHERAYEKLGAHLVRFDGSDGVVFAVWAPNARQVSVIGDFNDWDPTRHPMHSSDTGIWTLFIPALHEFTVYKYHLTTHNNDQLDKADPFGFAMEERPRTGSVVARLDGYPWQDGEWIAARQRHQALDRPISIYEVHLGSWRREADPQWGQRYLTYRELADTLIPYVKEMGYTHIELLPIAEHPFDGSWGYQVLGFYAPTSRFGTPEDFMFFIDQCHAAGLGVILDWVPAHFPKDGAGLNNFDGTQLYAHANPLQGEHQDWGTLIFNYSRNEVRSFLISNALFWIDKYHIDGLRVDAVASMLYLDYSREEGQWIPNEYGGRENLAAISFLRKVNEVVHGIFPGVLTIAEESTSWPMVSRPTYLGGLGFSLKWNMGWMHDTLSYMAKDPLFRRFHHNQMTFGMLYAFHENFVLPLSHDEVVHGKGSLLNKMSGDEWQKFANLRAYFGFMWGYSGKKLLFMGCEFGQWQEWNHDTGLEWQALTAPRHQGLQRLVRDLNLVYQHTAALHEVDFDWSGFRWIDANDSDNAVFSFVRYAKQADDFVVVVCNFTPVVRTDYRIGVPTAGPYRELINSDLHIYGGSGVANGTDLIAQPVASHTFAQSLSLTLPPLATLILQPCP